MRYIIRDHDMEKFLAKKQYLKAVEETLNEKYGAGTVEVAMHDSYFNMREMIVDRMYIVEKALAAMDAVGVTPNVRPIRGGTDGARLSFMGLPCPNLSTGGRNFHGRFEYIPVEDMEKMVQMLVTLLQTA